MADKDQQKTASGLFDNHLKYLSTVAGMGWFISLVLLNFRIQIPFSIALILISLMIIGLRQAARYIVSNPK
jgi:hypothetical protein